MIVYVSQEHINRAKRGTVECPVYLAARDAGLDVQMVGVGVEHPHSEIPAIRMYLIHKDESIIQPLPSSMISIIRAFDKTGELEPFSFEIPIEL